MKDLEELLRDTLVDPRRRLDATPGMYETVHQRARVRRHRRLLTAAAAVAVIAVATTTSLLGVQGSTHHRVSPGNSSAPLPAPSAAPASPYRGSFVGAVQFGPNGMWNTVDAAAVTADALYVVTDDPNQVVLLSPTVNDATGAHDVKATQPGPSGTPSGIVVGDGLVWAWSQDSGELHSYDANTLKPLGTFELAKDGVFQVVECDDALWFTSTGGLFELRPGTTTPARVAAVGSSAYGLAADPARHRVLVSVPTSTSFEGVRILAVDTTSLQLTTGGTAPVGKESIAVVDNQVWVGGYGDSDNPRVVHFSASTLQPIGSSPVNTDVGPGAQVWAGQHVLWVRDGGSEGLSCLAPTTGAIVEQWTGVQGPVTSLTGSAYAVEGGLQQLTLGGGCTG